MKGARGPLIGRVVFAVTKCRGQRWCWVFEGFAGHRRGITTALAILFHEA